MRHGNYRGRHLNTAPLSIRIRKKGGSGRAGKHHFLSDLLLVFAGALLGAALRVAVTHFCDLVQYSFYGWDWTYLFINVVGAFAFGLLVSLFKVRFPSKEKKWYVFVSESAAASFTAFDLVFSQISLLFLRPNIVVLIFYVAVNFAACVVFSSLGVFLGSGKKPAGIKRSGSRHELSSERGKTRLPGARHGY